VLTQTFCSVGDEELTECLTFSALVNVHIGANSAARGERQEHGLSLRALAAGQTFAALIVADEADDLSEIRRVIGQHPRTVLGGSRSAGYGQVTLSVKPWHTAEALPKKR